MDTTSSIDLEPVSHQLQLPLDGVQRTVELLEEGNTIPFITRYRKDQTGGLDEEQIRRIHDRVTRLRLLAERKQTILKAIQSQQKLTPELAGQIDAAQSLKLLEDLYLPYRLKKQTLATQARQRGLEPLAREVLAADPAAANLEDRAAQFVNAEQGLPTTAEVLAGVGHLLAEYFSENARLRGRLRKVIWRSGRLVSKRAEPSEAPPPAMEPVTKTPEGVSQQEDQTAGEPAAVSGDNLPPCDSGGADSSPGQPPAEPVDPSTTTGADAPDQAADSTKPESGDTKPESGDTKPESGDTKPESADGASQPTPATPTTGPATDAKVKSGGPPAQTGRSTATTETKRARRREARERKRQKLEQAFKDYYDYCEPLTRIPPHRVLAINRGDRAKVLRVKIEVDQAKVRQEAERLLVPPEHPHADLLRSCVGDALTRLVMPALEREVRRELSEEAEAHAVEVFARNLRKLLLQPPLHGRRVLAVDPGFRSGCKLAALDEFGNVLGHGVIYLVGSEKRQKSSRARLVEMIRTYHISAIAIGNGTACRETEQLVADVLANEFKDDEVAFAIANEAGASVYSTSPIGREEFPDFDATVRGAISIGRRMLDPLSELVKINPANIGVGLYQHDIKAKPLRASLDAVVESCVNFVGVDVNTASPSLLGYVSGLNQLTARRLYDHRQQHGPFRCREQLKEVQGIGETTYVQAAGFLKINGGDNPLDATWIHPESYDIARRVLDRLDSCVSDLAARIKPVPEKTGRADAATDAAPGTAAEAENEPVADQPPVLPSTPPSDSPEPAVSHAEPVDSAAAEPAGAVPSPETSAGEGGTPDSAARTDDDRPALPPLVTGTSVAPAQQAPAPGAPLSNGIGEKIAAVDTAALAGELGVGQLLLRDILADLVRPGRDPREDLPPPMFRRGIMKLEDLEPGMELSGTVMNVVDFGAFIDIGLSDSGLVHVSRLADRYVSDPHDVVSVGEVVKVWVLGVDKQRRRVSLTAIAPGTEKPREPRRGKPARGSGQRSEKPAARQAARGGGDRPRPRRATVRKDKSARKPRAPRKPVVPITEAMAEGREPMRTFGDLKQFFEKKDEPEEQPSPPPPPAEQGESEDA